MVQEVMIHTNVVTYLMVLTGCIGIVAKLINHCTLRHMLRAAANMSKSTHKLMKLVRAKYEHACMAHDKVWNVEAFVEKYIYEYRGMIFRIHTWRQLQIQSIWFAGIFALIGAFSCYEEGGLCESVYQYLVVGGLEMLLLYIISQTSDEQYRMEAVKNYMVDYLENNCVRRSTHKTKTTEKDQIDVITAEPSELSINIEGSPRQTKKLEAKPGVVRRTERGTDEKKELKEEKIRQILEEFLA